MCRCCARAAPPGNAPIPPPPFPPRAPSTDGAAACRSFHTPEYVRRVKAFSAEDGGEVGDETTIKKGGYGIAALAAGGAIAAVSQGTVVRFERIDLRPPSLPPPCRDLGHLAARISTPEGALSRRVGVSAWAGGPQGADLS